MKNRYHDKIIAGEKYGLLTALEVVHDSTKNCVMWKCRCDCGNECVVRESALRSRNASSCGCRKKHPAVVAGMRFGRLTALEYAPILDAKGRVKRAAWKCKCDCGNETIVATSHLRSGHTQSCGCYGRESFKTVNITHGATHTPLYRIWAAMKRRCYTPSVPAYKYYGAKGVRVCDEWRENYAAFAKWARENGYKEHAGLSIDRIDSNGNYEPQNCRIISLFENRSRAHKMPAAKELEIETLYKQGIRGAEIIRRTGLSAPTVYQRLKALKAQETNVKIKEEK